MDNRIYITNIIAPQNSKVENNSHLRDLFVRKSINTEHDLVNLQFAIKNTTNDCFCVIFHKQSQHLVNPFIKSLQTYQFPKTLHKLKILFANITITDEQLLMNVLNSTKLNSLFTLNLHSCNYYDKAQFFPLKISDKKWSITSFRTFPSKSDGDNRFTCSLKFL